MLDLLSAAQITASGLVLAHGAWWALLSAIALPRPRRALKLPSDAELPRIAILVPAHNEERSVATTVQSLLNCDYPGSAEVVVIADNCTDATAVIAREAGATVLEREDLARRGKSFALRFGLDVLGGRTVPPDAVAVVDADSVVASTFLTAVAGRLMEGAYAVQVHYQAAQGSTDLARIRRMAFSLVHWARPLGLSRLGLGTSLKGNGMAFRWDGAAVALASDGLAEDAAATLALAKSGIKVAFEPCTFVTGFMASDYRAARVQDARWEGGRLSLLPAAVRVTFICVSRRRLRPLPGVFEAVSFPLTLLAVLAGASTMVGVTGGGSATMGFAALASLVSYVLLGMASTRPAPQDLAAIRSVPRFFVHKVSVLGALAMRRSGNEWRRTARN